MKVYLGIGLTMPLIHVMPSFLGPLTAPANLMMLGAWILYRNRRRSGLHNEGSLPFSGALRIWLLAIALSFLIRGWREFILGIGFVSSFYQALQIEWSHLAPIIIFVLAYRTIRDSRHFFVILVGTFLAMSGEALLACYERLTGVGRATAHLMEENRAGIYFCMALPFFLALFLSRTGRIRWLFLAVSGLQVVAIFATLSRGAMLAGAVGSTVVILLFFLLSKEKAGGKVILIALAIVLVNTWQFLVPQDVVDRVLVTIGGEENVGQQVDEEQMDGSAQHRLKLWRASRELIRERPWGYGASTSISEISRKLGYRKATHSMYYTILLEMGFQGLAALIIMILAMYRALWRLYRTARSDMLRDLGLALIGSLTGGLVATAFVDHFFRLEISGQFWLLAGGSMAVQMNAVADGERENLEDEGIPSASRSAASDVHR